jgi:hypothetical protein
MPNKMDPGEMWLQLVLGALNKYEPPEKTDSPEELVDDMIEVTTDYANGVLDAYEEQFGAFDKGGRSSSRSKRTRSGRRRDDSEND